MADLSVQEAAERLHLSPRRVRELLAEGRLEGFKTGRKWAVSEAAVEEYLRLAQSERRRPSGSTTLAPDLQEKHRDDLLSCLFDLRGIEPFSVHDSDLATWSSKPQEPSWPVPKGRAWRRQDESLEVKLDAESKREWRYLRQHLEGQKVWEAIGDCQNALAGDLAARLTLMDTLAARIREAPARGGLGLPIGADLGGIPVTRSEVTIYYLFTIHNQVLSRDLGLRHAPKRREEFAYRDPGYPEVVSLGGVPAVRSTDARTRRRAVSFLLEAQERFTSLPEAAAAAEAYRTAEAATKGANDAIQDVLLMPGFPPGSTCDLCRSASQGSRAPER